MSLLDNFDQVIVRPEIRGQKHSLVLCDIIDGNNTTNITIPFGCVIVVDESVTSSVDFNNPPAKIIAAATDTVLGISLLEYTHEESYTANGEAGYPPASQFPIMRQGEIKVLSETANDIGDPVYVRYAVGAGGTNIGFAFRNTAVTNETLLLARATWVKKNAGTNEISAIRINF